MSNQCMKARPTVTQLADRLRPIDGRWPDGLELYLAAADLSDLDGVVERIQERAVPDGFAFLIEGPVDSLDGGDFDVTRESPADFEVVRRLAELARRLGARAVNIHLIAPGPVERLTVECREALLRKSEPILQAFVTAVEGAGAVPTIENMPPVLRMRRADFAFTPIGMAAEDLRLMAERVPGLKALVDTSHAGLYLNVRNGVADDYEWLAPLRDYTRLLPDEGMSVLEYVQHFDPWLENAQVSNAGGILGEGLPYAEGDLALDPIVSWLDRHTRHQVIETLEPNHDDAQYMRDALTRMRAVLA
jgi:sugar phosphate isomerase/epimerase